MPRPARGAFRLLAALGLLQAVVLSAPAALGQCTLTSGPNRLDPGGQISMGWGIKPDHLKVFESSGRKRLLTRATYGYVIYDLSSPSSPSYLAAHDIHKVPGYERHGDGQTTVNMVGVAEDGSRLLVGYNDTHGTLIMTPSGDVFTFGGDFGPVWSGFGGGGVVVKSAGRSIAISAPGTSGALVLADATTPFTGTQAQTPLAFPKESFPGTPSAKPTNTLRLLSVGSKQYLVYPTMTGAVAVVDVTTPGPVGSIASGYSFRTFTAAEFGFSSGAISTVEALDLDGSLYLVGEGRATAGTLGVSIVKASLSGVLDSPRIFTPPPPYSGSGSTPGSTMESVSTSNGSIVFFWEQGSNGLLKLFALSTSDWTTDLAPSVTFSTVDPYTTPGSEAMAILSSGENVYIYAGSSGTASAIGLRCSSAASPASADLSVHPDPCPGGGASCPLAEGASVFVGDKLRIVPTVSPSPTTTELTDWRFDFDFHDGNSNDSGSTYPRLKVADLFYTSGQTAPPSAIALVGPCDPKGSSGVDTSTGTNCWASVLGNSNYGGPDFTGPFTVASEGTSKTLTLALEVQNPQNPVGTSGVKKFNLAWKIPKVKLLTSSVLLGDPVKDGSEGKPAATGFRWYFATLPDTPPTERQPLIQDTGCTGPVCNHTFPSKGLYHYWVTVPYSTGYTSEDCGEPCVRSRGQLSVTDVVLGFTAPSAVSKSSSSFTVTDLSTRAPSVTPCPATSSGYEYSICDAGAGACAPTSWLPISFPTPLRQASIPTPTPTSYPGTYWLRLRYSYSTTSDCSTPLQLTWQPGTVAGNADVWQFAVTNVIPTIWLKLPNGSDVCPLGLPGCPPFPLEHGATIKAYAYIGSAEDPNPPAITWDFGHAPASGSGQGAQHTYTNSGTSGVTYYITLNGYGVPVTETVTVTPQTTTTPPSVNSVSASTYSPTVGQNVTFVCNASPGTGGSMTYAWTFSDGGTGSGQSTSHAFGAAGTYSAQCRVTNSAGTATGATSVTVGGGGGGGCGVTSDWDLYDVNTGGQISLFSTGFDVTSGQRVRFVGRSSVPATGVTWNFGDGSASCGTNPCEKIFTYTGTGYKANNVTLSFSSCSAMHVVNVSGVTGPPPVPNLDFGVVDAATGSALPRDAFGYMQATSGQSLRFTATGAQGAVTWNFGDASATTTEAQPTHTFNTATDASYTVRVTDSHTTPRTKSYTIQVAGSAGAPLTANFTFKYADSTAVNASAVQPNKAVKFTSVDLADSYLWDFGDGTALGTGSPVEHTFTRGGTFSVSVTVARAGVTTTSTNPPKSFTVLAPPEPLQWMLGGMAYAPGLEGTFWQSDVTIYNPSPSAPMRVELAFLDGRVEPNVGELAWISRSVNARSSDTLSNVLFNVFGQGEGAYGSILVKGVDVPVNPIISGRTYNRVANGTYGLSVPAVRVSGGVQPQGAAASNILVGLRQTPPGAASAGFRSNLAVSNLKSEWATVDLTFYGKQGQQLGQKVSWTLAPLRVFQVSEVLRKAPPQGAGYSGDEEEFSVVVDVVSGSSVYPYATVIDNRSGDPIVVTPQPRPSSTFRLPGVIRSQGQNQTVWRSDVVLCNPSSSARKVRVAYSYVSDYYNPPRRRTDSATIDLAAKQSLPLYDFVASWLQIPQTDVVNYTDAFVDISPDPADTAPSEPILAMGRTYNDQATGSVGLQLGAFTGETGVHATSSDKRLVLSGLASGAAYRSNVVVFLASAAPTAGASLTLHVFNGYGLEVKRMEGITLDSQVRPIYQIPDSLLFANVSGDRSQMTVVVDSVTGSVPVAAYATVIDQVSGDATYVQAVPTP